MHTHNWKDTYQVSRPHMMLHVQVRGREQIRLVQQAGVENTRQLTKDITITQVFYLLFSS